MTNLQESNAPTIGQERRTGMHLVVCDGQAGITLEGSSMPLAILGMTRANFTEEAFKQLSSNIKRGAYQRVFQSEKYARLDYSLQLAAGIRNYHVNSVDLRSRIEKTLSTLDAQEKKQKLPEVIRGNE